MFWLQVCCFLKHFEKGIGCYFSSLDSFIVNPYFAGIAAFLGLTIIDNVFYCLAFSGNKVIEKLKNKICKKTQDSYVKGLHGHPVRTLVILSLIPEIRFFRPIFAVVFCVKWSLFFLVNGLGPLFL
ncbi:hypothetical protein [Flavobacterium sp. Arc3]|uniref:hypothetical protein n=1 Tax=Flavobacterium sp. Arc3 TaxID=3046686 RepID=UPI00352F0607